MIFNRVRRQPILNIKSEQAYYLTGRNTIFIPNATELIRDDLLKHIIYAFENSHYLVDCKTNLGYLRHLKEMGSNSYFLLFSGFYIMNEWKNLEINHRQLLEYVSSLENLHLNSEIYDETFSNFCTYSTMINNNIEEKKCKKILEEILIEYPYCKEPLSILIYLLEKYSPKELLTILILCGNINPSKKALVKMPTQYIHSPDFRLLYTLRYCKKIVDKNHSIDFNELFVTTLNHLSNKNIDGLSIEREYSISSINQQLIEFNKCLKKNGKHLNDDLYFFLCSLEELIQQYLKDFSGYSLSKFDGKWIASIHILENAPLFIVNYKGDLLPHIVSTKKPSRESIEIINEWGFWIENLCFSLLKESIAFGNTPLCLKKLLKKSPCKLEPEYCIFLRIAGLGHFFPNIHKLNS